MKRRNWEMAVPLSINAQGRDDAYWKEMIKVLKGIGATRVFMATISAMNLPPLEEFKEIAERAKEVSKMLRKAGIEPCIWMGHTIGHGGSTLDGESVANSGFTKIVGCQADGTLVPDTGTFCPMNKQFQRYICDNLAALASAEPEMLMIDDDYRLCNHHSFLGCFCELHMARVREILGQEITAAELAVGIRTNIAWRKAWRQANGESLYDMAAAMEKAVHSVSKNTRFGISAVPQMLYKFDGTDVGKLAQIMAGPKNRPFFRTCSAPYWSRIPDDTCWLIESTRLQEAMGHAHDASMEIFAEGDTYPHNTFMTGATNLEAFHEGVQAAGLEGILSYQFSYMDHGSTDWLFSSICKKNANFHKALKAFIPSGWNGYGVEPIVSPEGFNFLDASLSGWNSGLWRELTPALRFLPPFGIPLAYGNTEMPVFLGSELIGAFSDEELRNYLSRGAIVDAPAAEILLKRGIDIGIADLERLPEVPTEERCNGVNYVLRTAGENLLWNYKTTAPAEIRSTFGDKPGVAFITHKGGKKVVFLPWNTTSARWINLHFGHQELMQEALAFLTGRPMPVKLHRRAHIRLQIQMSPAKHDLTVVVQNTSPDDFALSQLELSPDWKVTSLLLPGKSAPRDVDKLPNTALHSLQMALIRMKRA